MAQPLRAAPLQYSTPSSARFVILIVALLCTGAFVGTAVHNVTAGDRWVLDAAACDAGPADGDPLERQRAFEECMASAERVRTAYALAGAAVALLCGIGVAAAAPAVIQRRRGLRRLPPTLSTTTESVGALAIDAGVTRAPDALIGRAGQRDAFTFGVPGKYRIALPPKLALRPADRAVFDPIVLHELAHVSHHDVALAWMARGVWFAVVPLACLPVVLAVIDGDFSILPDYAWRAAGILIIVRLVANEVLRVREHEADVAVAADPLRRPNLVDLLTEMDRRSAATAPSRLSGAAVRRAPWGVGARIWGSLGAQHPTPARRLAVVADPTAMLQPTVLDGFTAALLAATAQPLLQGLLTTALTATGWIELSTPVAALATGALLGGSVGVGLWRATVYGRVSGRGVRIRGLGAGVGFGLAAGQFLSLSRVGVVPGLGDGGWGALAVWILAGIGATATVAGLGAMWADLAPRVRSVHRHRIAALGIGTLVFALALWGAGHVTGLLSWGGWSLVPVAVGAAEPGPVLLVGALALVVAVAIPLVAARGGRRAPAWALEGSNDVSWPISRPLRIGPVLVIGIACGLGGCAVIIVFRSLAGAAESDATNVVRFFDYTLVAAAAGLAAVVVLSVGRGPRGAAASLVCIPVAITVTLGGFAVLDSLLGGGFSADLVLAFADAAAAAAFLAAMPVASLALLSPAPDPVASSVPAEATGVPSPETIAPGGPAGWRGATDARARRTPTRVIVLPLLGFAVAALLAGPIPLLELSAGGSVPLGEAADDASEELYVQVVAPGLAQGFGALGASVESLVADGLVDPDVIASRIREDLLPILEEMQSAARRYDPPTQTLSNLHAHATGAIDAFLAGYSSLARAYDGRDVPARDAAVGLIEKGAALRQTWLSAVVELGG